MSSLWGAELPTEQPKPAKVNPCLHVYGLGPNGKKCETCIHLRVVGKQYAHYKCDLRMITGGTATDHRVRWPACAKYEEAQS